MIELENIAHDLGSFRLKDISFQVKRGEYFVLLGESGAGKSVLLEIIVGLIKPDHGSIRHQGCEITNAPIQTRGFGLVYQDQSLFPHLSVFQNIAYPLTCRKRKKEMISETVQLLAEKVGITHLLQRHAGTLSIGEAQRTALARALATEPDLLLLDEPLAALDVQAKSQMRALLRKLNAEGQTIVHVTHDYQEARALATTLAAMENGTVIQSGSPEEVFHHPKSEFIAKFTGVKNFYRGRLERRSSDLACFKITNLEFDIVTDAEDGPGCLMIDSDNIVLSETMPHSSARNCFEGVVTDIEKVRLGVEVHVDIGILLIVTVTLESRDALQLVPGKKIWVNFKASSARYLAETPL